MKTWRTLSQSVQVSPVEQTGTQRSVSTGLNDAEHGDPVGRGHLTSGTKDKRPRNAQGQELPMVGDKFDFLDYLISSKVRSGVGSVPLLC